MKHKYHDLEVDGDKFDAVLRRMTNMKPMTAKELSAKLKAERETRKAAKQVQKNGQMRGLWVRRRVTAML